MLDAPTTGEGGTDSLEVIVPKVATRLERGNELLECGGTAKSGGEAEPEPGTSAGADAAGDIGREAGSGGTRPYPVKSPTVVPPAGSMKPTSPILARTPMSNALAINGEGINADENDSLPALALFAAAAAAAAADMAADSAAEAIAFAVSAEFSRLVVELSLI